MPPAPFAASVPENVPFTAVTFPAATRFPLPSIVTKFVVPPALNASLLPVAVNVATVVAALVAAMTSALAGCKTPCAVLVQ